MARARNGMKETNNRKLRRVVQGRGRAVGARPWGRPRAKLNVNASEGLLGRPQDNTVQH